MQGTFLNTWDRGDKNGGSAGYSAATDFFTNYYFIVYNSKWISFIYIYFLEVSIIIDTK